MHLDLRMFRYLNWENKTTIPYLSFFAVQNDMFRYTLQYKVFTSCQKYAKT